MKLRLVMIRQEVRMRSKMKVAVLIIEIMVPELEMKLNPWAEIEWLQLPGLVSCWGSKLDTKISIFL